MFDLDPKEYQEIVFLTGSKKGFAQYLGLDQREMNCLWKQMNLVLPTDFLRNLNREELEAQLAYFPSMAKMAERYGISEAFLRTLFPKLKSTLFNFTEDQFTVALQRYKSVRLMARCLGQPESHLRREAERLEIEIAPLLDYSVGSNSNAKGRRAELEWCHHWDLKVGQSGMVDLNLKEGSQATADFEDTIGDLGRVNVKSSRRWKYRAQTRKDDPYFWKFSTRGRQNCDTLACMAYDDGMNNLVGVAHFKTTDLPISVSTLTLKEKDLWPTYTKPTGSIGVRWPS